MNTRKFFGAIVNGISGKSYYMTYRRRTADFIRRICRKYKEAGGWTGGYTLKRFVEFAMEHRGKSREKEIIYYFMERGRLEEVSC